MTGTPRRCLPFDTGVEERNALDSLGLRLTQGDRRIKTVPLYAELPGREEKRAIAMLNHQFDANTTATRDAVRSLARLHLRAYRFTWLRNILGSFLLISAGLKIEALINGSWVEESLSGSLPLQVAAVELEILLAMWLVSGWGKRQPGLLALDSSCS